MSLLPSKDGQRTHHARGGLYKEDSVHSSETTRLLSRQTSDSTGMTPYPRTIQVHPDEFLLEQQASSVGSSSVKRYVVSRQASGVSSKYSSRYASSHHYRGGLLKDDESVHSGTPKILVSRHGTNLSSKYALHYAGLQKDDALPTNETSSMLMGLQTSRTDSDAQVALLVYNLFDHKHVEHQHPKTIPELAPEKRGKRHRHPALYRLNQFRHWWKTSRLLVRLSGYYGWVRNDLHWVAMATFDVTRKKGVRKALKQVKRLGRGGENREFLLNVHPFTRTLRIVIALARAWEARVDNRFYEVGIAEAMAFMGNRCFRYWARHITDWVSVHIAFPFSGQFLAPFLEQNSRPVILVMGFVRAILPFMSSYMGSAFGRKTTFAAYNAANYRWRPVQGIMHFHETRGCYQDIEGDEALLALAREISVALGHDQDPVTSRAALLKMGFEVVGAGSGGLSVYRKACEDMRRYITLHITPYGPSIVNEMPRYIILERRFRPYHSLCLWEESDANIFDAAIPPEAEIQGFTYSGAYFTAQEWAALKGRYVEELTSYYNACKIMGTPRSHIDSTKLQHNEIAFPPTDLVTLKAFIRTGHTRKKRKKETRRWKQVQASVKKIADSVQRYKSKGLAPNGVILYFDGLDCSGKSSTGGLICDALEKSGYTVSMVQYNRPPTKEEKKRPWMDRFVTPLDGKEDTKDTYAALVWDRGPAGDFVYGNLNKLCLQDKLTRYEEFRQFDLECEQSGILFCKLLFVADKDSIAETLGKRLAHKQIAKDLQTWLDANSYAHFRDGLEEITGHIDPTDFIAYNKYEENLDNFSEFARNTDNVGHVGVQKSTSLGYSNPWHVVSTYKRHPARLGLMKAFRHQLFDFALAPETRIQVADTTTVFFGVDKEDEPVLRPAPKGIVEEREHGISIKACIISSVLGLLVYAYAYQTWNFKLEDIT